MPQPTKNWGNRFIVPSGLGPLLNSMRPISESLTGFPWLFCINIRQHYELNQNKTSEMQNYRDCKSIFRFLSLFIYLAI
jgi:hypothetical protein